MMWTWECMLMVVILTLFHLTIARQFEEEDSVCSSWISDNDQVAYWSGWKESTHSTDVEEKEIDEQAVVINYYY